ncbi:Facilitated trehalose transporter Tret1 [Papilio xuthus]|uniref:Facilitated trehalose transporter Tret1 n=1 Tax=Papilio xuthus TaxID=66420 RepID=A0A194QJ23_PAPXU|nr:Facilitated trehalose transporter Tret1 [Papilio xuthus]
MSRKSKWITPFLKQSFVTSGVTLNLAGHGICNGFAAILLPQLQAPDSSIPIDDSSGSWIVSVSGFALVVGNFIIPIIMGKYGRRIASMASLVPMILGWIGIILATNIPMLIISRLLQGLSMGMGTTLGPVLIGEYTSPKNRGAFLTVISVMISVGVLIVHTLGSYLHWQTTAVYCAFIAIADLIIVLLSPESPSWLADRGKYDESKKVFRWLRGDGEENELERMITSRLDEETKIGVKETKSVLTTLKHRKEYLRTLFKRKEFYKPIVIMIHIYILSQWAGVNILITYTVDLLDRVVGKDVNIALIIITLDSQRIISNIIGVYFIKKKRRRFMLMMTGLLAVTAMLVTALYSYLKQKDLLLYDHPLIGVLLLHFHMLTVGLGSLPICYIIAGELFPLEFRSIAGGISVLFHSTSFFIIVKTVPFLFKCIGLHGAYCLYSFVVGYCLLISWWFLPETKDKTLQEIEDEFRGASDIEKTVELMPMNTT